VNDRAPILEFDPTPGAIIEPRGPELEGGPAPCVLCFFQDVIGRLAQAGRLREVGHLASEIGRNPVYALQEGGSRLLDCIGFA
jgi:hypothetical protein